MPFFRSAGRKNGTQNGIKYHAAEHPKLAEGQATALEAKVLAYIKARPGEAGRASVDYLDTLKEFRRKRRAALYEFQFTCGT